MEFQSPASDPHGLAWDGHYLWVCDRIKDEIYRVNPNSGAVVMILSSPGEYPRGLAWMDRTLWNVDYQMYQDDSNLTIAMCGAAGLPARYVGALVVRGDDASLDYVFHRWVEVYLPMHHP